MVLKQLDCVLMRGGTSRGVFVRKEQMPDDRRNEILIKLMGSPDPLQVDGLGGGFSSTSKAMLISLNPSGVVDYLFAQIAVDKASVDYSGNCGNLTSAVGPFAVDQGLVKVPDSPEVKDIEVSMFNVNTQKDIVDKFAVKNGQTHYAGGHKFEGVPASGAAVEERFMNPGGTVLSGPIIEPTLRVDFKGKTIEVSVVDVTNLYVFVKCEDFGLTGTELPPEINANSSMLNKAEQLRQAIAKKICERQGSKEKSASSFIPRLVLVSKVRRHTDWFGKTIDVNDADILVRAFSMGKAHHAVPFTAALCTAAAAKIPGTVAYQIVKRGGHDLRIAHPKGVTRTFAKVDPTKSGKAQVEYVSGYRTARVLMKGTAYFEE